MTACAKSHNGPEPYRYFADFIEGRRGEILDAALAVFGDKGYEAGTMREIAASVGVTEPAIYRHYEGKEAILSDIVATAGDRIAGEMRRALIGVSGENIVPMLYQLIQMRRRGIDGKLDALAKSGHGGGSAGSHAPHSGAGGVMHILFHAAPHNETFTGLLRAHLGKPMVQAITDLVPRVDADFGIERAPGELDSKVRVFMSLFAGYFTTTLLYDAAPNDDAIVDAMLAIMGWGSAEQTG